MTTSLLSLLDDIASLLHDVSHLTETATKKTAGVLGDDLALNAEQVTGVRPDRELAVVWAVAKGSALNKVIIVPAALLMSTVVPWIITPILMLGGGFLCFEGFEKVAHKFLHSREPERREEKLKAISNPEIDLAVFEKEKIKGAIRTDFVLSAEIVVIALGTVQAAPFWTRTAALATVAVVVTVGVYLFVAGIVKMDDVGLSLKQHEGIKRGIGGILLWLAPRILQLLSVVGTIAMFLVGGGILIHGLPFLHQLVHGAEVAMTSLPQVGDFVGALGTTALTGAIGLSAGGLITLGVMGIQRFRSGPEASSAP